MKEYIVDACVFTGYLAGEKSGLEFIHYLDKAFNGEIKLIANTVNLGEVYYSSCKYKIAEQVEEFLNEIDANFNLDIYSPTYSDCIEAGKYKALGGIAYFDCFNLVLAKKYPNAEILTLDGEYKKFEKDFKIKFL
jgi:predicted nucleic acid-binding protein